MHILWFLIFFFILKEKRKRSNKKKRLAKFRERAHSIWRWLGRELCLQGCQPTCSIKFFHCAEASPGKYCVVAPGTPQLPLNIFLGPSTTLHFFF